MATSFPCLLLALAAGVACGRSEKPAAAKADSTVAVPPVADARIVQERADWTAFAAALPRGSAAAAAALERYRREHGVPFDFFLQPDVPDSVMRALRVQDDEMGCGALLTAFVHRIPRDDRVLMALPAIEFDTAGRTLRRWPLPGESGFFEIVS